MKLYRLEGIEDLSGDWNAQLPRSRTFTDQRQAINELMQRRRQFPRHWHNIEKWQFEDNKWDVVSRHGSTRPLRIVTARPVGEFQV